MKVHGVMMVFTDVPRGPDEEKFNLWYDLDHLPEALAVEGMLTGRRYHAEDAIMQYRSDKLENAPPIGQARYCAMYLLGDPDIGAFKARIAAWGERLYSDPSRKQNFGKAVSVTFHRLVHAYAATRIKVSADALPYLSHRGLQVAMGHVPDPKDIPEATEWWHSHHYPDMLKVPGWAAALKCEPFGKEGQGKFMHLFLLDKPAKQAHELFEETSRPWREKGWGPHPRGIYKRIFSGPFSAITPLQYDFLK
jgi:hypothetical protein